MILAVDVGSERVGVATADLSTRIAVPIGTFFRNCAEKEILEIITKRGITTVVVGLPLNEDGSEGVQCQRVRNFIKRLKKRSTVVFEYVDEYATSEEAAERIRSGGKKIKEKGMIDAVAASIILERYLELQTKP